MLFESIRNKVNEKIKTTGGSKTDGWLFLIAFAESSFFPVPPDFFLLPAVAKRPEFWKRFSLVVTVGSILGAAAGYFIGMFFFDYIGSYLVEAYNLQDDMTRISELFNKSAFWAIFTAAFTPIPYKIFTLAGGFFNINFFVFIIASILGRGMRFFAVGYISKWFGEKAGHVVFKHFNIFTMVFAVVVILYAILQFF
ncbi:MAG: VTT domain-containing protein [bacterium]|nr:VTT domain-containing protein [bacterium]